MKPKKDKPIIVNQQEDEDEEFSLQTVDILDDELDVLRCRFNGDDCVEINTEPYTYITLSIEHLKKLIKLIKLDHIPPGVFDESLESYLNDNIKSMK